MKISIDIDVTPEEARRFFGLPDVGPMHDALISDVTERMRTNLARMEPEALWGQWMSGALGANQGVEAMRQFWEQAMRTGLSGSNPKKTTSE